MIDKHLLRRRILQTGGLVIILDVTVEVLVALPRMNLAIDELFAHQDFKLTILFLQLFNVEWSLTHDRRGLEGDTIAWVCVYHVLMALHLH